MYSIRPNLIIGFHGCDILIRDSALNGLSQLIPSTNNYDWLGNGIYFWENNESRAYDFINQRFLNPQKGKPIVTKPSVLGAVFTLGKCLDLLDSQYLELLRESYKTLDIAFKRANLSLPQNTNVKGSNDLLLRKLDCLVIEHLMSMVGDGFDSVRGVFMEGKPLYPTSGFWDKNHIQIAIRNLDCIKGYFLPRKLTGSSKV
jgi:hypothetical protein